MRILVISDTHAKCNRVYDVYKKLNSEAPIDIIVHCGDYYSDALEIQARLGKKVVWVKGNSDGCFDQDNFKILETEVGDFMVVHGHLQNVGYSQENLYYFALENGCVGAFFGHTHRAMFSKLDDFYLMNPGSLSEPRDGSGGTFGLMVTSEDSVWGKIYRYEDFMEDEQNYTNNSEKKKPKVQGGHLRDLLNYSDRF